jgi:hypothetical protein
MAIDLKYGQVTLEHGNIGEDEPVIVLRAKDKVLPTLLYVYEQLCAAQGSPERHLKLIEESRHRIEDWERENGVKVPDSEASREWMDH